MTREEALLYLPMRPDDDLERLDDLYDAKMHTFRTFFISVKRPTSKLFLAKIETFEKVHAAYEFWANEKIEADFGEYELLSFDVESVFDLVITFQQNVSNLKLAAMQCESVLDLKVVAQQMLDNMKGYARSWQVDVSADEMKGVKISEPTDDVDLLKELEKLNKLGKDRWEAIAKLDKTNVVYQEAIRLSLWNKIEGNV